MNRVFVYGTLLPGQPNAFLLEGLTSSPDQVRGCTLYDLGPYPMAAPDPTGVVLGRVYNVDPLTLRRLDWLESEGTLYIRKSVRLESGHTAWMYVWGNGIPEGCPPVLSGDWMKHHNRKQRS